MTPHDRTLALVAASAAERWAPLPVGDGDEFGWAVPGYWVSTLGRVVAVLPSAPRGRRLVIKALRPERRPGKAAHLRTNLHVAGGVSRPVQARTGAPAADRTVRVHRLVAAAWLPRLGGYLIRHLNGDGTDNRVVNLLRGTDSENLRDQYAHGTRGPRAAAGPTAEPYTCPDAGTPF